MLRVLSRLQGTEGADEFAAELDGAPVVVELWSPGLGDEVQRRAQARAAVTAQTFTQGGVVRVHEVGVVAGRTAIVRAAFGAGTLHHVLATGVLPPPVALAIAASLAQTLAQAHAVGLVHGRLEPRLVHLSKDAQVRLSGFGRTKGRGALGDVQDVGRLLYRSLTGKEPPTPPPEPEALAEQVPGLQPKALSVVLRSIDPSPARGFSSASALARALVDALDATGGAAPLEVWRRLLETRLTSAATVLDDARVPRELRGELKLEHTEPFDAATDRSHALPEPEPAPRAPPEPEQTQVPATVVEPPSIREARARPKPAPPVVVSTPAPPAPTRRQYAMPFQKEGDVLPPDVAFWRRVAERRERYAARAGFTALIVMLGAMITFWALSTDDHLGALISYLPGPLERVLAEKRGAKPKAPGPPKAVVGSLRRGADPSAPCYEATGPERGTLLIVSSVPVEVQIDGRRLCGDVAKVSVDVGERQVWVREPKDGAEQESFVTIEAGKTAKLVAF